jgi:hypothetical protein
LSNEIVEANGNFPKRSPSADIVVVGSDRLRRMVMLWKTVIALLAVTSVGMTSDFGPLHRRTRNLLLQQTIRLYTSNIRD